MKLILLCILGAKQSEKLNNLLKIKVENYN